jgi:16S rRNA (adenine1518-N6/adenine1519-N6)-dimethyltransferase
VRRRLGQHFLARGRTLDRIAEAACPAPGGLVVEIGAGDGALTASLLRRAARVAAIELDEGLVARLRERFAAEQCVEIVAGDALKLDLARWGRVTIAGNLPYYITSPLIAKILALGDRLDRAVLMVQQEVAARLAAAPGSRDYGYLSVRTQAVASVEPLFSVPREAFRPPPRVDSAVVRLTPRAAGPETPGFLEFAALCFRQKRKTLRNNLAGTYGRRIDSMEEAGLRAEQLSVPQLLDLYRKLG